VSLKKLLQNCLLLFAGLIFFYSYYYLPSKNLGSIEIEVKEENSNEKKSANNNEDKTTIKNKTIFLNTEYKTQNNKGQVFTTKARESFFYQNQPDLIYLVDLYSFTTLNKDQSIIEIRAKTGMLDKLKKVTSYEKDIIIKNKNYLITANTATYFSDKNIIIIDGNVIMKDLTMELSHVVYCDTVEINTLNNDTVAFMKFKNNKVVAKKFK